MSAAVGNTPIRFHFRGALHNVSGVASTCTVLEWLRVHQHAVGTKEGCNEGDCGACTVVIGQLDPAAPQGVSLLPVNACIHLLGMLDGKVLLTVEDLAGSDSALHPVQQAMVDCHASQCGFCTPGFVMTLYALYENQATVPVRAEVNQALAGNLCRCTGYRPIVDAALNAWTLPVRRLDRQALFDALQALQGRAPLDYQAPPAQGGGRLQAPASLEGLALALQKDPRATLLAGATDIGLWITKLGRALPHLIHLDRVPELHHCSTAEGVLEIGAAVTHREAWTLLTQHWPALQPLADRFAAPLVCNAGTLGGNVANGSPIGDSMPPLLALDARLVLQQGGQTRELPLCDFYLGYQRNQLQAGEFLRSIRVPLPQPGQQLACYKISKRRDQDISSVCAAFLIERDGHAIGKARVAFGGMAAIPKRAAACEAALQGGSWQDSTLQAALQGLAADYAPLSDLRASASYRQAVAAGLLQRFWMECQGAAQPLQVGDLELSA